MSPLPEEWPQRGGARIVVPRVWGLQVFRSLGSRVQVFRVQGFGFFGVKEQNTEKLNFAKVGLAKVGHDRDADRASVSQRRVQGSIPGRIGRKTSGRGKWRFH